VIEAEEAKVTNPLALIDPPRQVDPVIEVESPERIILPDAETPLPIVLASVTNRLPAALMDS